MRQSPPLRGFVRFPADRAARYRAAGYWTGRPVDSILPDAAQRWPDRIAVLDACQQPGWRLTFAELDDAGRPRGRRDCAALGIAPGDRVLLQLPNTLPVRRGAVRAAAGRGDPGDVPARAPGRRTGPFRRGQRGHRLSSPTRRGGFDYPGDGPSSSPQRHPQLAPRHRRRRPGAVHVVVAAVRHDGHRPPAAASRHRVPCAAAGLRRHHRHTRS